jgi:hypothetical protein
MADDGRGFRERECDLQENVLFPGKRSVVRVSVALGRDRIVAHP